MTAELQADVCSWCGHPRHPAGCPKRITVAAAPSAGKAKPTEVIDCPCRWRHAMR